MSEERDNPSKNFAITGHLKEFPKEGEKKPTLDDFNDALLEFTSAAVLEAIGIHAFVGQVEVGEGGTMHLQGFAQTVKRTRRSTLNKKVRKHTAFNWSIQNMGGSVEDNVAYCTKVTGPWEYANGTVKHSTTLSARPVWVNEAGLVKKGQRNDIKSAIRAIENGATMREIDQRFPSLGMRYGRQLQAFKFRKDSEEKKDERLGYLGILYGPPGTGKSWAVRHHITAELGLTPADVFAVNFGGNQPWFDGYNGERILLIDDYEHDAIRRRDLVRMTDIYAYHAPVKGGHVVAAWDYVFITTNDDPAELFGTWSRVYPDDGEPYDEFEPDAAMYSRVDVSINFSGMPDRRSELKARSTVQATPENIGSLLGGAEGAGSVAPLLPATSAHGTGEACDEGRSGVRGSIPRPVDAVEINEATSAQSANLGTKLEGLDSWA